MRSRVLFAVVALGIASGLVSAYQYATPKRPQPPAFQPAPNPYAKGIYANGIVESDQLHGANINIYPEVPGVVTTILVVEGQRVERGTPLLQLDDSVQRATVQQQQMQSHAARSSLEALKAQPRKETLAVAEAQMELARANLKTAQDQRDKLQRSSQIDPRSVSRDALDNAVNAAAVAQANLDVMTRQYELTRAGAWVWDVQAQQRQYTALKNAAEASEALLARYTLRAPVDGVVLSIKAAVGSYLSAQGTYDTYTQGFAPAIVMGTAPSQGTLAVRCYIDEILIPRLPQPNAMVARMFIRGTNTSVPLEFVRVQPYVSPKIQLSNARTEKVDVRVLPIVFRFQPPTGLEVYPGQLVDVYVGDKEAPNAYIGSN